LPSVVAHTVLNHTLPGDDFNTAVRNDQGKPDVVIGSSRGGPVAINID
jgi:predicted alternative tryptophan synthase beta-subunit